ncbi:methionyl-tRNA formyltransferase [Eggerthellaceae bacterium 3-80]|nr:methionyl-tRNA formyltransferase [bacterium D16-34]
MRIVFMGTPAFAADILEELYWHHEIVGVFTRPDAVRGRGKQLEPSPVKACALEHNTKVFCPQTLRDDLVIRALKTLEPDVICVAAYGKILPPEVLEIAPFGCLNVHASLLPHWRGAAPIERAILAGDEQAGVCIMAMEEGLDTGDYCISRATDIADKPAERLTAELAALGAQALLYALNALEAGEIKWVSQDEAHVTYAGKIEKGELNFSLDDSAVGLVRKVQASSDAHPSHVKLAGRDSRVLQACVVSDDEAPSLRAGELMLWRKRLIAGTADGLIEILQVKPAGKNVMDGKAFAAGIQGIKQSAQPWEELHA